MWNAEEWESAATELLASSAEEIATATVLEPGLVGETIAVERTKRAKGYVAEGDLATSLEMVPGLNRRKAGEILC